MEKQDEELILDCQDGDQTAFKTLFERYKRPVFNFALRILGNRADAEDVTADVMLVVLSKSRAYVHKPGVKFSTWLFTVARNACVTLIRKRNRMMGFWFQKNEDGQYQEWDVPDSRDLPPEEIAKRETVRQIKKAIYELPLNQKEALVLREYHGLSYGEIAEVLQCSLENVKILIFRARGQLRIKLSGLITEAYDG